nr:response regulator [Deltaproteobacteria bacterium]
AKGGTAGVVITFIDVSGLKAAEDALFHERYLLNSLLSSVPDAVYFRDQRGKFIRANPAATARLGLEDPVQAVGKTPFDVPAHEAAVILHSADDEVIRSGQPQFYKLEKRSLREGGSTWDLVTRLPLTDPARNVVGVIGIVRDVTTEKLAEAKIQEGVRRRDEFLAMLSHELRNPLAAVVTATEVLKHKVHDDDADTVKVLDRQSQQMARLLDDLLDASRVTQNKIELRKEVVDLRGVVEEAAAAARPVMESRDLTFSVVVTGLPLPVLGDASRLQQVCMNMLINAAKYTPAGGHVLIEASEDGACAVVRVRDDGVGVPAEMVDSIFELFVQSNRTLERAQGGIGVGLTLARSLIQMHGGTISVQSDGVGKGSVFEARLPLSNQRALDRLLPAKAMPIRKGARIVVVEDNVDARDMLCHLLTRAGFDCKSVGDGVEGIRLIEKFKPQAAIIDVGLPGIDGFEVARRLRANPSTAQVRLIALTGYGQKADREIALQSGFNEHLVKPVKFEQLTQVLTQLEAEAEIPQPIVVEEQRLD